LAEANPAHTAVDAAFDARRLTVLPRQPFVGGETAVAQRRSVEPGEVQRRQYEKVEACIVGPAAFVAELVIGCRELAVRGNRETSARQLRAAAELPAEAVAAAAPSGRQSARLEVLHEHAAAVGIARRIAGDRIGL
jgi:hypothetical protein